MDTIIFRGTLRGAVLVSLIKKIDCSQDLTISAFTNRAIKKASNVDWVEVSKELQRLELPADTSVPSSVQVQIYDDNVETFEKIRHEIERQMQLKRNARSSYCLNLVWCHYLNGLRGESTTSSESGEWNSPKIMAKMTELIISNDPKAQEKLNAIRKILRS